MPLYLDEVEIEDTSNIKIEQLIDMDNLSLSYEKKNFVADSDKILVSTFDTKSFYRNKVGFNLVFKMEKEEILSLHLDNDSASDRKNNCTIQTAEKADNKTQEAIVKDS